MRKQKLCVGLACLTAALGLAACGGGDGGNNGDYGGLYGSYDYGGMYSEMMDAIQTTYDQTDKRIALPKNSTYKVGENTSVTVDKVTYKTTIMNGYEFIDIQFSVYCTISGDEDFTLRGKLYDAEGYCVENLSFYGSGSDEKAVLTDTVLSESLVKKYLKGGYRLVFVTDNK